LSLGGFLLGSDCDFDRIWCSEFECKCGGFLLLADDYHGHYHFECECDVRDDGGDGGSGGRGDDRF